MNHSAFFGILSLLFMGGSAFPATSSDEAFHQGNAAFVSGKYAEAVQRFESCLSRQGCSAPILYNLGNACFRDGKIGPAILNYERARWLAPGDPDLKANLQLVQHSAGLFESTPPKWQALAGMFSLNAWTWMATVAFLFLGLASTIRLFRLDTKWSARPWIFLFAGAWLFCASSAALRILELNRAVVVVPETPLRITPLETSPAIFNLTAGSVVRIKKQRDSFFYIHSQDGKEGWVSQKQVERIIPRI